MVLASTPSHPSLDLRAVLATTRRTSGTVSDHEPHCLGPRAALPRTTSRTASDHEPHCLGPRSARARCARRSRDPAESLAVVLVSRTHGRSVLLTVWLRCALAPGARFARTSLCCDPRVSASGPLVVGLLRGGAISSPRKVSFERVVLGRRPRECSSEEVVARWAPPAHAVHQLEHRVLAPLVTSVSASRFEHAERVLSREPVIFAMAHRDRHELLERGAPFHRREDRFLVRAHAATAGWRPVTRAGGPCTGRVTVKVEPLPGSLRSATEPPSSAVRRCTSARPRPVPP
ncbi:Hypothetical protein I5071_42620 [Sandaracinus amylolyticus]|nr:Hypothetical protein I5071_42620 [Sandaracinus amylolyticus]